MQDLRPRGQKTEKGRSDSLATKETLPRDRTIPDADGGERKVGRLLHFYISTLGVYFL